MLGLKVNGRVKPWKCLLKSAKTALLGLELLLLFIRHNVAASVLWLWSEISSRRVQSHAAVPAIRLLEQEFTKKRFWRNLCPSKTCQEIRQTGDRNFNDSTLSSEFIIFSAFLFMLACHTLRTMVQIRVLFIFLDCSLTNA